MKTKVVIFIALCSWNLCLSQSLEFNLPWQDTARAIIIDPYSSNKIDWKQLVTDSRVVGIIHKATQGLLFDPAYNIRKRKAKNLGLKWGSYHLGQTGDPIKQADFYLSYVGINDDEVFALDIETIDSSKSMSLFNATRFIKRIFEKTGRFPFLYCNNEVITEINKKFDSSSIFSSCPLWYARFRKEIPFFLTKIWKSYTLWQFSSELNCHKTGECLYNVPGTKFDMDINIYNGTKEELISKWTFIK